MSQTTISPIWVQDTHETEVASPNEGEQITRFASTTILTLCAEGPAGTGRPSGRRRARTRVCVEWEPRTCASSQHLFKIVRCTRKRKVARGKLASNPGWASNTAGGGTHKGSPNQEAPTRRCLCGLRCGPAPLASHTNRPRTRGAAPHSKPQASARRELTRNRRNPKIPRFRPSPAEHARARAGAELGASGRPRRGWRI